MNLMRPAAALTTLVMLPNTATARPADFPNVLQSEMGSKGSPQAFSSLVAYAECVMKHERQAALSFLGTDFPSTTWRERGQQLASDTAFCMKDTPLLVLNPAYLRGALIESAYHHDLERGVTASAIKLGTQMKIEQEFTPALAQCVVQRRADTSAELLSTKMASAEQAQVFAKLEPDLSFCARQAKVSKYVPEVLRLQIAEALYRQRVRNVVAGAVN